MAMQHLLRDMLLLRSTLMAVKDEIAASVTSSCQCGHCKSGRQLVELITESLNRNEKSKTNGETSMAETPDALRLQSEFQKEPDGMDKESFPVARPTP